MILLDSNIIIYSYQTAFIYLKPLVIDPTNTISAISRVEILGFHGITSGEEIYCQNVFKILRDLPISELVLLKAIELRKNYKLKLGDSIVAATALVEGYELYTRNTADFIKIPNLVVINPII
jgi:toxin FitB